MKQKINWIAGLGAVALLLFFSWLSAATLMILFGNIHAFAPAVPAISIWEAFSVNIPIGIMVGLYLGFSDGFKHD